LRHHVRPEFHRRRRVWNTDAHGETAAAVSFPGEQADCGEIVGFSYTLAPQRSAFDA